MLRQPKRGYLRTWGCIMIRSVLAIEISTLLLVASPGMALAEDDAAADGRRGHHEAERGAAGGGVVDYGHRGHHRHHGRPYRHPRYYHHPHPPVVIGPSYPYYPSYYYPYYPPPLYIPAEELYGPGPVQRLMGVDHWFRPKPNVNILVVPKNNDPAGAAGGGGGLGAGGAAAADPDEADQPGRATNAQAMALAWKFIGYGDAHFAEQKYLQANARYRKAARAAPQLPDIYVRQGYAYLAMGRYDLSADAIRRGLGLDPTWPGSAFTSEELYGDNDLAKGAQLDALAKAAEDDPTNADLPFLLGVFLHFDGQADRAQAFFQRAEQLAGGNDGHIRAFLE